ncbi:MAG: hypothetical protein ABJC09_10245 [Terriglobia bacterium]
MATSTRFSIWQARACFGTITRIHGRATRQPSDCFSEGCLLGVIATASVVAGM